MTTRLLHPIQAREVVPGMKTEHCEEWETITEVRRVGPEVQLIVQGCCRCTYQPEEIVTVQLPGPSPRTFLCTCWPEPEPAVITFITVEQAVADTITWRCRSAEQHQATCRVAPNDDRAFGPVHGGLRLYPRGGVPAAKDVVWRVTFSSPWGTCTHLVRPDGLRALLCNETHPPQADRLLMAFCRPSRPPIPATSIGWDPYPSMIGEY